MSKKKKVEPEKTEPLKVSIITAAYMCADGLARAVECVEAQVYANWEHIVVFDGPQPNPLDISHSKKREFIWTDKRHDDFGVTPLNVGIAKATGDLIMVLADDNEILPDHIEKLVPMFEKDGGLGFAYSFGNYVAADTKQRIAVMNPMRPCYQEIELGLLMIRKDTDARFGPWVYTRKAYDWDRVDMMMQAGVRWKTNGNYSFVFNHGYREAA